MPAPFHLRLEAFQARTHTPTSYENALGDGLESVFGSGVHDLDGVVAALNAGGVRPPHGGDWTAESLRAELHRLAEGPDGHPAVVSR
jgi:hypothetical protein